MAEAAKMFMISISRLNVFLLVNLFFAVLMNRAMNIPRLF